MNVSIRSAIATIAIATGLVLTNSAIAAAEAYKTSQGHVIVTGLTPTQRYQIRTVNAQNKPGTRQDKSANSCGEVVVEKAANYKTLVVGSISIDPATLPTQTYVKCKPRTVTPTMRPRGVVPATTP
ncbi:hypothetical protein TUMEXPCC7403_01245 [Tumidithrix helvetica PCC 7403]|uniref:hypothetical protein n=1 Tax=Tumidithrix helvetica TaxID=3457545 RepID=UPI003C95B7DC